MGLASEVKVSSVVPGEVTGNKDHQLSNMDLAMKLHYIKAVYLFDANTVPAGSLSVYDLKRHLFPLLQHYYTVSGRIRRSSHGRPFIKCNDGGVRIVEAFSDNTLDEWLALHHHHSLLHHQVLGPDLPFSPFLYIKFTLFKSGGISVGLSWAHVLGDPISIATFVNTWSNIMRGRVPPKSIHVPHRKKLKSVGKFSPLKTVDPVGDHWWTPQNGEIQSHTFHITAKQLDLIKSDIHDPITTVDCSHFELLSALIWKSLSKIRDDSGPTTVAVCDYDYSDRENELPTNKVVISTVEAEFSPRKSQVTELAALIANKRRDAVANSLVDEMFEKEGPDPDVIVYGSNLTLVNMEGADVYGLKLQGQKPVFVNYTIDGVGEEGVVMVIRRPEEDGGWGRTVTVILPEIQLSRLKLELKDAWGLE